MDLPKYQQRTPFAPNPPLYSEKKQEPPPAYEPANPVMPIQYQPYSSSYSAMSGYQCCIQPPLHTTIIVPVQPTEVPDYLWFSICSMFCCPFLGIAALVFSIRTWKANWMGYLAVAQWNSRMAQTLASFAFSIGAVLLIVLTIVLIVYSLF